MKSLAKTKDALNVITKSSKSLSDLKKIGKLYTTEILKAAMAQSALNEKQIKAILYANGLRGEILKTTTAEVLNAASTNAVAASQAGTTATTLGLGTAFQGLGIKIQQATASMRKFLITNPLGWATLAIGAFAGIALGIKKYNDSLEEAKQKIRETADEAKSSVSNIKSDFDKLSSTTNDIKSRYAKLAQGVENLGKVNQSHGSLNTDEYTEFLNLSNQLAELFPQLTVNYDENGNAILGLSGNVNTIVGSLNDLVSAQQKLANQEIMKNMPDIWAGFLLDDEEFDRELKSAEKSVENHLRLADDLRKHSTLSISNESDNNLLIRAAKEAGIMNSRYGNDFYSEKYTASEYAANSFDSAEWDFTKLSEGEFNKLLDKLEEFGAEYEDTAQIVKGNIASANSGMAGYINTWLSTEWNFSKMDSDMQHVIKGMLQSGDWVDFIPETVDAGNWDEVSEWLQSEFLYEISKVKDNHKISTALSELFTNQDLTPKEKADYIRQTQDYFGEDHAVTLSLTPELELTEDLEKQYQDAINFTRDKFGDYDPTGFFREHSINTQEELVAWKEIVQSARDAAEAERNYLSRGRESAPFTPLSITETINQVNTRLKPAFDSLKSAYQNIFSLDEDTGKQVFSLENAGIETFESIRSELEKLGQIDGLTVNYSAFEEFVSVLNDTSSTADDVQQQFDHLATSIIYATDCTDMSAETYDLLVQSLTEMGVTNAEEVLNDLKDLQEELIQSGYNLADITLEEAVSFIKSGKASVEAAEYLKLYMLQKELAQNPLNTVSDISALEQLCNSLGMTAEMLGYVDALKRALNARELGATGIEPTIAGLKSKIADVANGQGAFKFNFSVPNKTAGSGGSSASPKTERDTTKEYNWIEQAIENVEKEIKVLDETASSSYSTLSQKNEALTSEIGKVTEEIELQQKAYEEYMRKADSIGLPDSYKDLVQNGAAGIEDIKDEKLQEQIDGYQKWYEKAQNASDAIRELNTDLKDLRVESYKLQTETLKDRLDSESITEKQYLTELKAAYEQFYGNLSEYAEQYHEAKLEYLKEEKKYLNSVANAAASVLDTEIDRIREDAEKQEELLKTQAELLEARKKPLQEELEALDEKTRKEELAFHLQKAQYDLARAENQQTKLVYTADKGMIYTSDSAAVRDAKKGLDDAKSEIHKQSIQDQIDALDDEISRYDDLIDQINKAADAQVKALEQFKAKWQEVIDVQEQAKNITILTGEFGADAVAKILSGKDGDLLAQWKDSYLDTLKSIDLESQGYIGEMTKQVETFYQNSAKALSDAAGKAADAANAAAARNNLNILDHPITLENGTVLTPLQPGGRGYDLLLKTKPLTDKIMRGEMDIFSNAVFEGQRQMAQWVKTINYSNIINHVANNVTNNRNMQPVVHQEIHVTLPNVNNYTAAETLLRDLQSLSTKKYQVDW